MDKKLNSLVPILPIGCTKFTSEQLKRLRIRKIVKVIHLYDGTDNLDTVEDWMFEFKELQRLHNKKHPNQNILVEFDGPEYEWIVRM